MMPGRDDPGHGRGGVAQIREVRQQGRHCGWKRGQPHGDAGGDAHGALAADERPSQVQPVGLGVEATEHATVPSGQHDLDGQDVGAGDPVEQAVGTARSCWPGCRRPSTTAGSKGRGRSAARGGDGPGQVQVEHSGLDPGQPLVGVHLEDPVHLGGDDHHGRHLAGRGGPARQPGPGATRDEGAAVVPAHPHRRRHFGGRRREAHHRRLAGDHRSVPAVQAQFGRLGSHPVARRRRR